MDTRIMRHPFTAAITLTTVFLAFSTPFNALAGNTEARQGERIALTQAVRPLTNSLDVGTCHG